MTWQVSQALSMPGSSHVNAQPTELVTPFAGYQLLSDSLLNKGTAFSEQERDAFELHGLLPPRVATLDEQVSRRLQVLRGFATDLERYAFLRELQDTNETVFYALLTRNIEELLPIAYTPTVGAGCQHFSRLFRKPRGLFLSLPHRKRIKQILANPQFDNTEVIVVTDGERILGLGDQGAGGMGIPIGKLALYTACGGIHPVDLPAGVPRRRHRQRRAARRSALRRLAPRAGPRRGIRRCSSRSSSPRSTERWPHALLQWEDFAKANATRLLDRYRDRLCTFNDDIQGTAAVATGTLLSAIDVTGVPLPEQRIAIFGAGSAGCGIAGLLVGGDGRGRGRRQGGGAALLHGRPGRPAARRHERDHRRSRSRSCSRARPSPTGRSSTPRPGDAARRGAERQADHPDRRVRPARLVLRADRPRHGGEQPAAGDLPAVEPDLARRGDADRHRALEPRAAP